MILILAGVVLGPQKIRQVAFWLGRFTAQVRAISQQFTSQLNAELDALDAEDVREMQEAVAELKNLRSEVTDLQRRLRFRSDIVGQEGREAIAEAKRTFRGESARAAPPEEADRPAPGPPPEADETAAEENVPGEPAIFQPDTLPTPVPVADDPES